MVAKFFQNLGDYASAIRFLVLSKCAREAFTMAQDHNQMAIYEEVIGDDATPSDLQAIAQFFDNRGATLQAGSFWQKAGDFSKALKLFLKSTSEDGSHVDMAIAAVSAAGAPEALVNLLVQYLMGETDGQPKDLKYIFKLYMALKQYADAARTALIIAREEQNTGNYRNARDVLLSMYRQLQIEGEKRMCAFRIVHMLYE